MLKRLPFQKVELNEAARHAIYRALEEREALLQADTAKPAASTQPQVLYRTTWSDSATQAELQWQSVFSELKVSRRHPEPEFLLPGERIFDLAEQLLQWLKSMSIGVPELTFDGEGSLYIEWQSNNMRLSICLEDNIPSCYIYIGEGRKYNALPLTSRNLQDAVASYLA